LEAIVDEGFRAPALKGWLGEIYLALGRLDDAQKYLAEVCEESPNDFRAVLHANLGFLAVGEGDRVSQFVKTLRSRCPGFFFDISEAAGLGSWGREWERTPEALAQFLNTAIQSLRGDRADKVITYFVSGDLMRVAPWTSIPAGTTALPS